MHIIRDKVILFLGDIMADNTQYCIHGEENCNRCALNEVEAPTVHLHLILDYSTSMLTRWAQTISGLNEYIAARRADPTPYKITLTTFGLESEIVDVYSDADLDDIHTFTNKNLHPNGGGTALWSAVGQSLKKIDTTEPVLFIVITDGEENSSYVYGSESVEKLIEEKQKLGNYTFAYLGVDKAAWGQESKVHAFAASNQNLQAGQYSRGTYTGLSTLTSSYSSSMLKSASIGAACNVPNFFAESNAIEMDPTLTYTKGSLTNGIPKKKPSLWPNAEE